MNTGFVLVQIREGANALWADTTTGSYVCPVLEHDVLFVCEYDGRWVRVVSTQGIGWIHRSYVRVIA